MVSVGVSVETMTVFSRLMQYGPGSAGVQSCGTASGGYDVAPSSLGDSSRRMVGLVGGIADVVQSSSWSLQIATWYLQVDEISRVLR